jgi:protease-4
VDYKGSALTLEYSAGKLSSVKDPDGRAIFTFNRDGSGKLASVVDVGNRTYSFTYNANGFLASYNPPEGLSTYEYSSHNVPDSLFSSGQMGSEQIAELIEKADARDDVKSILVIVNSPGGSVVGSREIYQALAGAKKPKVAYFREMAASGGYYVGLGADYIISEPDALTGSIGARMTLSDMSELFGKIGYNETTIKTGEYKDIGSYSRKMSVEEEEILQSIVDEAYSEFESVVLERREGRLDKEKFALMAADARILTGRQAKEMGLVDEVGSKKDAIMIASKMAGSGNELGICEIKGKSSGGLFGSMLSGFLNPSSFKVEDGKITLSYR